MPKDQPSNKKVLKSFAKTISDKAATSSPAVENGTAFPIVGLGASAGGLDALKAFFAQVSENSGMAYIIVIHLSPKQPSLLPEILKKITPLTISTAEDGQTIDAEHIYVVPPGKEINVYQGKLQLFDLKEGNDRFHPIDKFLRSLAQDQGPHAAAIILSGTGTDGSLGVREISAHAGVVFAQTAESAGYDGMPKSAIATGLVDLELLPEEMPTRLSEYFTFPSKATRRGSSSAPSPASIQKYQQRALNKIFALLKSRIGHDFSGYKVNTILRRISRRMALNQVDSLESYIAFLHSNQLESEALFRELLIGVTSFFRDAPTFQILKDNFLPSVLDQMSEDSTFRAWIPGCSTGEEAYSLAIVLRELIDARQQRVNLQLFGTDINDTAIVKARAGRFPENISLDLSKERLNRFFRKEKGYFQICKEIRDSLVFSVQDVLKDPPFSHLNLLCCRNLLIYLTGETQKKLLPLFHYTLKPDGIMMLGVSESLGDFSNMFIALDGKSKIFRRQEVAPLLQTMVHFPTGLSTTAHAEPSAPSPSRKTKFNISQIMQEAILKQFTTTAVLVDAEGDILCIHGRTGKYLEAGSGPLSQNILDLARQGLQSELSSSFRAAKNTKKQIIRKGIKVKTNGDVQTIDLHVCPQTSPEEISGGFLVIFVDQATKPASNASRQADEELPELDVSMISELENDLKNMRESHGIIVEELETSNEELKSTNEELQSTNEELQSTNEELESSKEELQSLNEELYTVNAELQSKLVELTTIQDDMKNLLNSTNIATIYVDTNLCIRRFTQEATKIVNLIDSDIGRPIQHIVSNLNYETMISDLTRVLDTLMTQETEVQTSDGEWYKMMIMPYRTTDNRIDGAVLTFSSIDKQKKSQKVLQEARNKYENAWTLMRLIFDISPDPMVVLNSSCKTVIGNKAFIELLDISEEQLDKLDILDPQGLIPQELNLAALLEKSLEDNTSFTTETFALRAAKIKQHCIIHGRVIMADAQDPYRILLRLTSGAGRS